MEYADYEATAKVELASSFDQMPYDSQPFPEAHPAYLGALGRLHGLDCASRNSGGGVGVSVRPIGLPGRCGEVAQTQLQATVKP